MVSETFAGKAQSVLDFASHLQEFLAKDQDSSSLEFPDVLFYVRALPLPRKELTPSHRLEFDRKGVAIWNTCCKLAGKSGSPRYLAHLAEGEPRLFTSALKAAKACLDTGLLETAARIVEQLAAKQDGLSQASQENILNASNFEGDSNVKYLLLRVALAWKQDRLDLADHFYAQLEAMQKEMSSTRMGQLVDLCYGIGKDQFNRRPREPDIKWLKRACLISSCTNAETADVDMQELRLTLLHTYARALLASSGGFSKGDNELHETLGILCQEFGHKLPVLLLHLEIHAHGRAPCPGEYNTVLSKMIQLVHITQANHKMILWYIHLLKTKSLQAINALETYIVTRLVPNENNEWTESAILNLIWLLVESFDDAVRTSANMHSILDKIHRAWNQTLSPEAARSAHVVLWKQIERCYENGKKDNTIQWCRAALHDIFANAGHQNIGKLERDEKMMKCYLELSDLQAATQVFEHMAPDRKRHPLSQYVRYSLALRCQDDAAVRSALNSLATLHDERNRLLSAAVAEAIQHGTKGQAAQHLQRLLDKYKDGRLPPEVDACALLRSISTFQCWALVDVGRCTAQLLLSAIVENSSARDEYMSRLCGLFKNAPFLIQKSNDAGDKENPVVSVQDHEWFLNTGLNVAVQNVDSWPAKYILDLLEYSRLIQGPLSSTDDEKLTKLVRDADALYVQAVLYTAEARSSSLSSWTIEDLPRSSYSSKSPPSSIPADIKRTLYKNVLDKHTSFGENFNSMQISCRDAVNAETIVRKMGEKLVVLAPLAFEAALFMTYSSGNQDGAIRDSDESTLVHIIEEAVQLKPAYSTYSVFADMILSAVTAPSGSARDVSPRPGGQQEQNANASSNTAITTSTPPRLPVSTATKLLATLIDGLRDHSSYDVPQASRWIRCVVQVILDQRGADPVAPPFQRNTTTTAAAASTSASEDVNNLETLRVITDQSLALARSSLALARSKVSVSGSGINSNKGSKAATGSAVNTILNNNGDRQKQNSGMMYPSDELEWLATMLFNLAIDLFVAASSSSPSTSRRVPADTDATTNVTADDGYELDDDNHADHELDNYNTQNQNGHNGDRRDDDNSGDVDVDVDGTDNSNGNANDVTDENEVLILQPRFWASKAMELADLVLALEKWTIQSRPGTGPDRYTDMEVDMDMDMDTGNDTLVLQSSSTDEGAGPGTGPGGNGDGGTGSSITTGPSSNLLATMLRDRAQTLGWM
ncbi:hypothetical protein HRR76_007769 [Exophiala dermatitidis]|nr:hypothetical protein HRR76_007769 [Exophiala dermatitidis]KAJ4623880.1 hypothetical protein HRR85_000733 [Exophiala dermatitidis]KAJ4683399.1 hypothetical protein HRR92_002163 [Exophiala dermatitidis]